MCCEGFVFLTETRYCDTIKTRIENNVSEEIILNDIVIGCVLIESDLKEKS